MSDINSVKDSLNSLDDLLDNAYSIPLTGGKSAINVDTAREIIEDVRLHLPNELREAQKIVDDRKRIIEDARAEAQNIIRLAEERAKKLVDHDELVKVAQETAKQIHANTNNQNAELKRATNEFLETRLKGIDDILTEYLQDIRSARQGLKKRR